jgi:hypothetical protein
MRNRKTSLSRLLDQALTAGIGLQMLYLPSELIMKRIEVVQDHDQLGCQILRHPGRGTARSVGDGDGQ